MFFDEFFGDDFDGFFDDLEIADFAFVGGAIGFLEEEIEERKRIERETELEDKDKIKEESEDEIF